MRTPTPVDFDNVRSPNVVPVESGIHFPDRGIDLRPFEISFGGDMATVWGVDSDGDEAYVGLEKWPGVRVEGTTGSGEARQVAVSFRYYKAAQNGRLEYGRRLVLLDRLSPFGFGLLLPGREVDQPTDHEGEAPTWWLRGQKLGQVGLKERVILANRLEGLPESGGLNNFSVARILDGPLGDPRDPDFRETMGIREVPIPSNFMED